MFDGDSTTGDVAREAMTHHDLGEKIIMEGGRQIVKKRKYSSGRPITINAIVDIKMRVDPLTVERIKRLSTLWHCSKAAVVRRALQESDENSKQ